MYIVCLVLPHHADVELLADEVLVDHGDRAKYTRTLRMSRKGKCRCTIFMKDLLLIVCDCL